MNNSWGATAEVVMAFFVVVSVLVGGAAWFYNRGDKEGVMVKALKDNTEAVTGLSTDLRDFKGETLATLRDHSWRLKILEDDRKAYSEE